MGRRGRRTDLRRRDEGFTPHLGRLKCSSALPPKVVAPVIGHSAGRPPGPVVMVALLAGRRPSFSMSQWMLVRAPSADAVAWPTNLRPRTAEKVSVRAAPPWPRKPPSASRYEKAEADDLDHGRRDQSAAARQSSRAAHARGTARQMSSFTADCMFFARSDCFPSETRVAPLSLECASRERMQEACNRGSKSINPGKDELGLALLSGRDRANTPN